MNMLWSAQQAIEFLDAVANEDIDPRTMRDAIPAFLAAADGHTSFPLSPLLSIEFRRLTLSAALEIRDALARLLRTAAGGARGDGGAIKLDGLLYFPSEAHLLVAGPIRNVVLHQAVRLLNLRPFAFARCPAFRPYVKGKPRTRCNKLFLAAASRRGPRRRYCSDRCRRRDWAGHRCSACHAPLSSKGWCDSCQRRRRRWGDAPRRKKRVARSDD